jgi:hypothetical protein
MPSSSSSCHCYPPFYLASITCRRRKFLRKVWPIQLAFRWLISYRIFLCYLTLSNTYSFLTWSPSFSSTTFQNFPGVSDLLPEPSKFQHNIQLCPKCKGTLNISGSLLAPSSVNAWHNNTVQKLRIACLLPATCQRRQYGISSFLRAGPNTHISV